MSEFSKGPIETFGMKCQHERSKMQLTRYSDFGIGCPDIVSQEEVICELNSHPTKSKR